MVVVVTINTVFLYHMELELLLYAVVDNILNVVVVVVVVVDTVVADVAKCEYLTAI